MKKNKLPKLVSMALALCLVLTLVPIGGVTAEAAKKIALNKKTAKIEVKKTVKLKLKNATASKVKWSSKNKKIAKVSKKGVVTGVKKGTTKIYAKYKKKTYTCKVTVKAATKHNYWKLSSTIAYINEGNNQTGPKWVKATQYTGELLGYNGYAEYFVSVKDRIITRKNVIDTHDISYGVDLYGENSTLKATYSALNSSYMAGEKCSVNFTMSRETSKLDVVRVDNDIWAEFGDGGAELNGLGGFSASEKVSLGPYDGSISVKGTYTATMPDNKNGQYKNGDSIYILIVNSMGVRIRFKYVYVK